ncbi:hypothetical protein [Kitasatospora sp. NPDC088134]|uniref:hypothetical protein n=1 Tax=Kitasatospora sp. NPDC088134 TaxID=3364071 RepID=UPI00381DAE43
MTTIPAPAGAYRHAPDSNTESTALLNIERDGRLRTRREFLLRQAALSDRGALHEAQYGPSLPHLSEWTTLSAEQSAADLLEHDRVDGGHLGPIGPAAEAWTDNPRLYVRQEYPIWREQQRRQFDARQEDLLQEMLALGVLTGEHQEAADRGEPAPLVERIALARRRVAIQRLRVDAGFDGSVVFQHQEEAALRELLMESADRYLRA